MLIIRVVSNVRHVSVSIYGPIGRVIRFLRRFVMISVFKDGQDVYESTLTFHRFISTTISHVGRNLNGIYTDAGRLCTVNGQLDKGTTNSTMMIHSPHLRRRVIIFMLGHQAL